MDLLQPLGSLIIIIQWDNIKKAVEQQEVGEGVDSVEVVEELMVVVEVVTAT